MALGNGSKYSSGPLIFLSPRSRDKDKKKVDPHFEISRVGEDGKIAKTTETCKEVKGNLIKIDFKDREFNGSVTKHVVLYIRDDDVDVLDEVGAPTGEKVSETYSLDLTYGMASRSLFNSLITLGSFDKLAISYYENKRGFDTYFLTQNGEKTSWKFKLEELPEVPKVRLNGKEHSDYTGVNDFFEEELKAVAASLGGNKTAPQDNASAEAESAEPPAAAPAPVKSTVAAQKTTVAKPVATKAVAPKTVAKVTPKPAPAPVEETAEVSDQDIPF